MRMLMSILFKPALIWNNSRAHHKVNGKQKVRTLAHSSAIKGTD